MMIRLLSVLILIGLFHGPSVAAGIQFRNVNIEQAIKIAQKEGKSVFIDTYAKWCKPCKQMDRVFLDARVSTYFNNNFISVKIDMDTDYGKGIMGKYSVVWLPTLIIVDGKGNIKNKIDRLVTAEELLDIARLSLRPDNNYTSVQVNSTPFGTNSTVDISNQKDIDPNSKESIVYVYDERASSGRPHIMFHEAYLHLQLMDGKHMKVVKKYLSTQKDWTTEKNVRFIFDFLNSAKSELFAFFQANRPRFEEVVGKSQIRRTLEMVIHQEMTMAIPRPGFKEAYDLFGIVDPSTAEERASVYYINRLIDEENYPEIMSFGEKYLESINQYDHRVMHQTVNAELQLKQGKVNIPACIDRMAEAIIYGGEVAQYHLTLANLHFLNKNKKLATAHCERARQLALSEGTPIEEMERLLHQISMI